jgi:hypothetical protein
LTYFGDDGDRAAAVAPDTGLAADRRGAVIATTPPDRGSSHRAGIAVSRRHGGKFVAAQRSRPRANSRTMRRAEVRHLTQLALPVDLAEDVAPNSHRRR